MGAGWAYTLLLWSSFALDQTATAAQMAGMSQKVPFTNFSWCSSITPPYNEAALPPFAAFW